MKENEKILKAFANARRLQIVKFLKERKRSTVGAVSGHIKLSFRSTSKHLIILRDAGILDKEQKELMAFYFFADPMPKIARKVLEAI